jgi:hypothetical protein
MNTCTLYLHGMKGGKSQVGHFARKMRVYWVEDASFITLLFMLGFTIFVMPMLLEMFIQRAELLHLSLLAIFFAGIWSASNPVRFVLAIVLFTASLVINAVIFYYPSPHLKALLWVSYTLNAMVFIATNLNLLFRDNQFNVHRVLGAVNVYLLVGLAGAFLFELIHYVFGSSVQGDVVLTTPDENFADYIYYSMVSLTTVGYGDILPANAAARMLSVFLSTIGILYPAVVIAKLVSAVTGAATKP